MQDNGNSEGVGYLIIAQHFWGRGQVTLIKWMAKYGYIASKSERITTTAKKARC